MGKERGEGERKKRRVVAKEKRGEERTKKRWLGFYIKNPTRNAFAPHIGTHGHLVQGHKGAKRAPLRLIPNRNKGKKGKSRKREGKERKRRKKSGTTSKHN